MSESKTAEYKENTSTSCTFGEKEEEVEFENDVFKYVGAAIKRQKIEGNPNQELPQLSMPDHVKHGFGLEINKEEGTIYKGNFRMDRHHGKGKLVYELTGDSYAGDWVDGNIEGEGKFTFSNGDIYAGQFRDNAMTQGVMSKANGDEYAGDFKDDMYTGYSLYNYANGDSYCGDFERGKRHGDGVLKIKSTGANYAGRFEEGELIYGQLKSNEGEYLGQFAPVTRDYSGRGIMKFDSGDVYDGKWEKGLMHGHGTLIYADLFADDEEDDGDADAEKRVTSMFVGEFRQGKRVEGTLTYGNGDVYTGTITEDGLRDSGSIMFANGDEFAGLFEEGAMRCGIMTFKSGDVYSGEFKDSLFHGAGKMTYANGDEYSGEYQEGLREGSGQLIIKKFGG